MDGVETRPTWSKSERDVAESNPDYREQISFESGKEVPYGTKGSVRPDLYKPGSAIEVKNRNVMTSRARGKLVRNIVKQVQERAIHLPAGTKQKLIIDIRGQNVSDEIIDLMITQIEEKTQGMIHSTDIEIKW